MLQVDVLVAFALVLALGSSSSVVWSYNFLERAHLREHLR